MNAKRHRTPNFRAWTAVVLHRPHDAADSVMRQLERLGMSARRVWPELSAADMAANVVFFDADMGHDEQFPWPPGEAPMPLVALIGSEAPGRLAWALSQQPSAHLIKPVSSAGVFSALVIADSAFAGRLALEGEVSDLEERLRRRPVVARALVRLMLEQGIDETAALGRLRAVAMARRTTIEDTAEAVVSGAGKGALDEPRRRA